MRATSSPGLPNRKPTLRWLRRAPAGIAEKDRSESRLAVLSGTFNPPTRAHLALAERALEELAVAEVLFVLPEIPPHKRQLEASLEDRATMLVLAIGGHAKFSAAVATDGLFADIYEAVAPHYPAATRVFFLTGRDAAERILLHWPYPDPQKALAKMFGRFEFAVAERHGRFRTPVNSVAAQYGPRIHSLSMPSGYEAVSASLARQRVARGERIDDLVPQEVSSYIAEHSLYREWRG